MKTQNKNDYVSDRALRTCVEYSTAHADEMLT
jgi:hypothetical protein